MTIPWPPQPFIVIPLRTDWNTTGFFDENVPSSRVTLKMRRFEFVRHYGQRGPFGTAEYMETAE